MRESKAELLRVINFFKLDIFAAIKVIKSSKDKLKYLVN